MDSSSVIAVFAPIMPLVVEMFKKLFPTVPPRYLSLGYATVVALSVGVASLFLDQPTIQELLAKVGAITGLVFAIGTGLYKIQK